MKFVKRGLVAALLATGVTFTAAAPASAIPLPPIELPQIQLPDIPGLPQIPGLPPPPNVTRELTESYAAMERNLRKDIPGRVGVAITPVNGNSPLVYGSLRTARAWSTMKVPLSIAAERSLGGEIFEDQALAIQRSDNPATERLYDALGDRSISAITAVLREGGDRRTHVESSADDPPSFPGLSDWALTDQSVFSAHLPCLPGSARTMRLMSSVTESQRWGVAQLDRRPRVSTAVKGGWGPAAGNGGPEVVRQMAVVTTERGRFAVSMIAQASSGSHSEALRMLNRVGDWIGRNLGKMPVGRC